MLVPLILGADKTTVSVATGQNEFHPVYLSIGNVHNSVRHAHRNALLPIAFLSIPKGSYDVSSYRILLLTQQPARAATASRNQEDTPEFRLFRKQLYHTSLARILKPLKSGNESP
jgi:Plavaka transposase